MRPSTPAGDESVGVCAAAAGLAQAANDSRKLGVLSMLGALGTRIALVSMHADRARTLLVAVAAGTNRMLGVLGVL